MTDMRTAPKEKEQHPHYRALRLAEKTNNYYLLFPAFLTWAHLAFADAASLALQTALNFFLGFRTALP